MPNLESPNLEQLVAKTDLRTPEAELQQTAKANLQQTVNTDLANIDFSQDADFPENAAFSESFPRIKKAIYLIPDFLYSRFAGKTREEERYEGEICKDEEEICKEEIREKETYEEEKAAEARAETAEAKPSLAKRIARRAIYEVFDNAYCFAVNILTTPVRLRNPETRKDIDLSYNAALVFSELIGFMGTYAGAWLASKKFGWGDYSSSIFGSPIGNYISAETAFLGAYYFLAKAHFKNAFGFVKHVAPLSIKNIPPALLAYTLDAPFSAAFVALGAPPAGAANITYFVTSGMFMTLSNLINAKALRAQAMRPETF